jgi:hypothetical protein
MSDQRNQKGDIRLYATDTELYESAKHLPPNNLIRGAMAATFDQHRVVVRGDDGSSKSVSTVKTYSVSAGGTVYFNLARIRLKAFSRILGSYSALDRESACRNTILG